MLTLHIRSTKRREQISCVRAFERFCHGRNKAFGVFGANTFQSFNHRCRSQSSIKCFIINLATLVLCSVDKSFLADIRRNEVKARRNEI